MRRMLAGVVMGTAAMVLGGCPADTEMDERVTNGAHAVDGNDHGDAAQPVCLAGDPFVAQGPVEVRDAGPGDAHRIEALRWASYAGCERLVVDLVTRDGAPAERAGAVTAEVLRDLGVVRVALRDVEYVDPDATDAAFDGPLATRAFAGWSPDGRWVFVDVHLGEAAEAHVGTLDEPARVVVDLRQGGPAVPEPAPREDRVVVLEPRPGAASYPLTADAWGYFSFTIDQGPSGPVVLHVGEHSARDGTWEGVAIELEMG
jgi:hypothetical protein